MSVFEVATNSAATGTFIVVVLAAGIAWTVAVVLELIE